MSLKTEIFRFADYELDPSRRSFTCRGQTIALNPKTFDLLVHLAANSGHVVTKEELLSAVWPDSFVEERNLSQHVFLLRKALGTQEESGRLIVTIPGRGYQLAAPVETVAEPARVGAADVLGFDPAMVILRAVETTTTVVIEEADDAEIDAVPEPARRLLTGAPRRSRKSFIAAGIAASVVAAAVGGYLWLHRAKPVLREVVLADVQNQTGQPIFDDSLQSALRIDLEQSPYISLLSRKQTDDTLASMEEPAATPLTGAAAREVCIRTNHQVLLSGAIARIGSQYLLTLEATSCATGAAVAEEKMQIASEDQILSGLDLLTQKMRRELGEPSRQVAQYEVPVAQATTTSLDALRDYSQALDSADRGDLKDAQTLLQRAIAIDPSFASAYEELGVNYVNRLDYVQGGVNITKAWDLRSRTTERELLAIETAYNNFVLFDWEAATTSMKLYSRIYPDDAANWYGLALAYSALGMYPEAVAAGEQGYRLAPRSGSGAEILARVYRRADRFADAKRIAAAAIAEGKDRWGIHRTLFGIAFAEHDAAAMKAQSDWGLSHDEIGQSFIDQGFVAASGGKLREAREDFARARQEGLKSGDADFADDASMFLGGILIEYGDRPGAIEAMQQIRYNSEDDGTMAYFWAELGNPEPARRLIGQYSAPDEHSTLHLYFDLPELRAILAMIAHKPQEALDDLQPARKYQLRDWGVPYQSALDEEAQGLLDQAAADYRLILTHPGIEPTWPDYTMSHLRLARVLARQQKLPEARAEYQAFLTAWKDADADLPLFAQARREYAALH